MEKVLYDKINKRNARNWFVDNEGNVYINSDPYGVQMSGKITIIQILNNHPQYEIREVEQIIPTNLNRKK